MEPLKLTLKDEPAILTANPIFLPSGGHPEEINNRIEYHLNTVYDFFLRLGINPVRRKYNVYATYLDSKENKTEVTFYYSESSLKVNKSFRVDVNGKKSNIRVFRKLYL